MGSGGTQNRVTGSGSTLTGGFRNGFESGTNSAITGGKFNNAEGESSVVLGGQGIAAQGDYSIALGWNAKAEKDHSMAVNLMDGFAELPTTEQEGHFLIEAESFRFQIGNGKDKNGVIQSTKITYDNIDNLASALA